MSASEEFGTLQARLPAALAANTPGSTTDHVVVALPSYSLGESLLSHYVDRIPTLEHRYLLSLLVLHRLPRCRVVFVASRQPGEDVLDYYASLGAEGHAARERFHVLEVPETSGRSIAAKLLDREDLLARIRGLVGDRPALIEPWNVTEAEVEVALRLGIPVNGTDPALRTLGFKGAGRRLFRSCGVPLPYGVEGVTSAQDVRSAIRTIRAARPGVTGVVVKHDDSGSGDGNVVVDLREPGWSDRLGSLPDWYLRDLAAGGVVEERITGIAVTFPSAQVDLLPDGDVRVLATHEQVLGGASGQVYMGCRFPADAAYAPELAVHAETVGRALVASGALGRVAIDFAASRDEAGQWSVHALEINLRKGGTTHPFTTLRSLVPGSYDAAKGCWVTDSGLDRCYVATDNLVDEDWLGLKPRDAIAAVASAGLAFDRTRGTGVVLHMLSGLAVDGRLGLTAIGAEPTQAEGLHAATTAALGAAAASR